MPTKNNQNWFTRLSLGAMMADAPAVAHPMTGLDFSVCLCQDNPVIAILFFVPSHDGCVIGGIVEGIRREYDTGAALRIFIESENQILFHFCFCFVFVYLNASSISDQSSTLVRSKSSTSFLNCSY